MTNNSIKFIDLSNCCYPQDQNRFYKVKYNHTLKDNVKLKGTLLIEIGPGQNIESEVTNYLSTDITIYYTNYTLIKQIK